MKKLLATFVAWGLPGLFLASVLDGAGVPLPGGVDFLLVVVANQRPEQFLLLSLITVAGSLLGNLFLFFLARRGGQLLLDQRTQSRASKKFRRWFEHYGLLTVFISALVPLPIMPMKIFVLCSGALGVRPLPFASVFVCARVLRYTGLAYLGRSMGGNAIDYLKAHVWDLGLFAAALFTVLWLSVRFADRRRARLAAMK